jgi:hypothetical protein
VELTGSCIVIESVCREREAISLGLHGVRVRAEKETIFFLFPNDWEIPTVAGSCNCKLPQCMMDVRICSMR